MPGFELSIGFAQFDRLLDQHLRHGPVVAQKSRLGVKDGEIIGDRVVEGEVGESESVPLHLFELGQPGRAKEDQGLIVGHLGDFAAQPQTARQDLQSEGAGCVLPNSRTVERDLRFEKRKTG